jgi:hypothetical protein
MANSQKSFEVLYGRFVNGDTLIQALSNYDPQNPLIKKASLTAFIGDLALKDRTVTKKLIPWKDLISRRQKFSFRHKGCDENCIENRMRNAQSYVGSEIGKNSSAYNIIGGYLKVLKPKYKKKNTGQKRSARRSTSEQSYVSLNGYAMLTVEILDSLGSAYAPQNPNIQYANFKTFVEEMIELSGNITIAQAAYSNSTAERAVLYKGEEGLTKRQSLIKGYLASFSGGKKNQNYIEYDRLIKGK